GYASICAQSASTECQEPRAQSTVPIPPAQRAEERAHGHRRQGQGGGENRAQRDGVLDRQDGKQGRHSPERRGALQIASARPPRIPRIDLTVVTLAEAVS